MKRWTQGLLLAVGLTVLSSVILASAVAWGPHSCGLVFIKVIGCAIGSYESLAGGLLAADAAIFAGWLAWNAVQIQITAEETRAKADRVEAEKLLQGEMDRIAEALAAIWRVLEVVDRQETDSAALDQNSALQAVRYGIERIARGAALDTGMSMASVLGWERRRLYEQVFRGLQKVCDLSAVQEFDVWELLVAVKDVSIDVRLVEPETAEYFTGLFERAGKAWSLGEAVLYEAGMEPGEEQQASSWTPRLKD